MAKVANGQRGLAAGGLARFGLPRYAQIRRTLQVLGTGTATLTKLLRHVK